jgi:hypothetical protein
MCLSVLRRLPSHVVLSPCLQLLHILFRVHACTQLGAARCATNLSQVPRFTLTRRVRLSAKAPGKLAALTGGTGTLTVSGQSGVPALEVGQRS